MTPKTLFSDYPFRRFRRRPALFAGLLLAACAFAFPASSVAQDVTRKVIARTVPSYPDLAKKIHASGKVRVEIVIAASGSVRSARMVGGNPVFEKSAIDAIKQWRFEPAQVETTGTITLEFSDQ